MVLDTVQYIWKGIEGIVNSFLTLDNIFYIGVGFTLFMILFFFIKSFYSYECKLDRSVNRLNEWLSRHQTLTESNLLEFNNLIKDSKSPKILRKHWQQYMLYRDKLPSEYISAYNCIDKPAKTSSFKTNIKNLILIYVSTAIVTFVLSLITFSGRTESLLTYLSMSLVTPVVILLLGLIFTLILRAIQNYNLASLFQTFHIFNRYIDKASVTIPKYVDFEILFTKKEIKNGIPILGEYLEKRARQEQEELEEAQRNAVSHEEYNFAESGVDGSLVLERAMKESETYLNFKQRTLSEIQQFESEISTLKKNYENTSKDYQRKLQVSKENMERLRQQQEESTNRIEVNYIRKQQQDEVKKQEQLEKDQEDATNKFNAEINSLSEEIEKRRLELDAKKLKVQEAMESEYQTFSEKLHKTISTDVEKASEDAIQKISTEKDQYAQAITYLKGEVDNKDAIIKVKDDMIEQLQDRLSSLEQTIANLQEENNNRTQQVSPVAEEYIPSEEYIANEEYVPSEEYLANEEPLQTEELPVETLEENQDQELNNQPVHEEVAKTQETLENQETIEENQEENLTSDEQVNQEQTETEAQETEQVSEEVQETEQVSEEAQETDGHYDENGYYWFNDKTYYDSNGLYHDLEGNVYDSDGNLQATGQIVETETVNELANDEITNQQEIDTLGLEEAFNFNFGQNEPADNLNQDTLANENETNKEASETKISEPANVTEENVSEDTANGKENEVTEENIEEKPKRKAGRPRKEKTEEELNKPKRSVGRPKKEKTEEELNKPKRKAGRPRKEVLPEEENKPKRSVGRPKKEGSNKESKPKRSVGRPKKENNQQNIDILKHLGESLIAASEQQTSTNKKRKIKRKK